MIGALTNQTSEFASRVLASLRERIEERRNVELSTLLAYLQDATFLDSTHDLHLSYATRDEVANEAKEIAIRLFPPTSEDKEYTPQAENHSPSDPDEPEPEEGPTPPKRSCSNELRRHHKENKAKRAKRGAAKSATPLFKIMKDMESYEATGKRPPMLQKIYQAVSSIPPTSAEGLFMQPN